MGLLVIGAGGHAKVVLDAARRSKNFEQFTILDENPANWGKRILDVEIIGGQELLGRLNPNEWLAVIAVGENEARRRLAIQAAEAGWRFARIVHPSAQIGEDVKIGVGTVIFARAVVNASARIGEHVIINSSAIIEHDSIVGEFAHLAPGSCMTGGSEVGSLALLGARATVLSGCRVGDSAVVGAGAVVTHDVSPGDVVVGVPARPLNCRGD